MSDSDENEESKELLLEELRYASERLKRVNDAIDSKNAVFLSLSLVTLSIILSSLISIFDVSLTVSSVVSKNFVYPLTANVWFQIVSFSGCTLIISYIMYGLGYLLKIVGTRTFRDPFTYNPNYVLKRLELNHEELTDYLIIEYRQSNAHSKFITEKKAALLTKGINILKIGFIAAFMALIILIYIKIVSGIYG